MKLRIYFAVCLSISLISCRKSPDPVVSPKADIVHKTVDRTVKASDTAPMAIDINDDGIVDFSYFAQYLANSTGVHLYIGINPIGNNAVKMSEPNDNHFQNMGDAAAVSGGAKINNTLLPSKLWGSDFAYLAIRHDYYPIAEKAYEGAWGDGTMHYMPLKLEAKGNVYYGWANLSFDKKTEELRLTDFAWNKVAGQEIGAGDY